MTTEQIQYLLENEYIKLCIDYKKGSWDCKYIHEDQTDNKYKITFKLGEYLRENVELKVIHYAQYLDEYKLRINNDLEFLFESKEKKFTYLTDLHSEVIKQLISVQKVIPDYNGNDYPNLAIEFLKFEIVENSDIENTLIDLFFTPTIHDCLNDWLNDNIVDNTKVFCDWFSNFVNYTTKKFNIHEEVRKHKNRKIHPDFYLEDWKDYYTKGYSNQIRQKVLENARDYQKSKFLKEKIAEYETDTITNIPPTTGTKLNWLGTPAELCYFISEFMKLDYIQTMPITQTARIINKLFNIKQQDGKEVSERTLQGYLGNDKKSYLNTVMRIPQSENSGKK